MTAFVGLDGFVDKTLHVVDQRDSAESFTRLPTITKFAGRLTASSGKVSLVEGPFVPKPLSTTGAGDHFNSGFCLGKLLGLDNAASVLTGVSTNGHYVRTGLSPSLSDLAKLMRNWPAN